MNNFRQLLIDQEIKNLEADLREMDKLGGTKEYKLNTFEKDPSLSLNVLNYINELRMFADPNIDLGIDSAEDWANLTFDTVIAYIYEYYSSEGDENANQTTVLN